MQNTEKKILHIITGLSTGGAEMMLYKLLSSKRFNRSTVICLNGAEHTQLSRRITELGFTIYRLKLSESKNKLRCLWQLRKIVLQEKPDVVQGWMYHGNLIACIVKLFLFSVPIVWNVRHSLHDLKQEKHMTRQVIRLCALISWLPKKIIYNSNASIKQHEAIGYSTKKSLFLPNGFDVSRFTPDRKACSEIRTAMNLREGVVVIGLVARFHEMKGHSFFLDVAKEVINTTQAVHFLLIGNGVDNNNTLLSDKLKRLGIEKSVTLLGERSDLATLTACFDIAVSASQWGEGFSNAIGEAMCAGVPCIATNVGDAAYIVDRYGVIVEPNDVYTMTKAINTLIYAGADKRRKMGEGARRRMLEYFDLPAIADQYKNLYDNSSDAHSLI